MDQEGLVSLQALAAKIGLRNKRRLYKGFHDLRRAIVAKNRRIRKQRVDTIESTLRAAFDENTGSHRDGRGATPRA